MEGGHVCMYDMSGFDYDIRDVVRILNLKIRRKNAVSYDADCPFCGETKGKLNINIKRNVFRCNRCGAGGGMIALYAELHGIGNAEANRQIREALQLGQYRDEYQRTENKEQECQITNSELASLEEIDHTYREMLSLLVLSEKHKEDLLKRGLSIEQIEEQKYRSVPVFAIKSMVRKLMKKGCTVKGVPGFYFDTDGEWNANFSAKMSGILIPIININGKIQGFQIRLDQVRNSMKYIWFSSVNKNLGVSSGSPIHVIGDLNAEDIMLTEGALKGTVAHYLSGETYICVAGVNQYKNLPDVLEKFKKRQLKCLHEAYDMDKLLKTTCNHHYSKCNQCFVKQPINECPYKKEKRRIIQKGCNMVYEIGEKLKIHVEPVVWDTDENGQWNGKIKGIDDFYYFVNE